MSKSKNFKDMLELPPSAYIGGSKIIISSNNEAIVEGSRCIVEYSDEVIKLNLAKGVVTFIGKNLSIESLSQNGIMIAGKIQSLEF